MAVAANGNGEDPLSPVHSCCICRLPSQEEIYGAKTRRWGMARRRLMNPEQIRLYERIKAFRFDEGDPTFPFVSRLARENRWSRAYAVRAITEYRKFIFLAIAAGHPVTPSDQVDQVWHLHLLYTRSYWDRFCREILGCPLHHEPTKGGNEKDKFGAWYAATLKSYRCYFGEEAPADIWPDAKTRFGEDIHFERVNTKRFWALSKAWVKTAVVLASVAVAWLIFLNT